MGRSALDITPYMDKLVNAILIGATYELAALYAGISHDTFLCWRKKAAQARPGTPLADFITSLIHSSAAGRVSWRQSNVVAPCMDVTSVRNASP